MANSEQLSSSCFEFTPEEWIQNKYKFKVPVYQRLFAWGTPQFDRLLSDLQEWNNKGKSINEPYYLGIITVVKQGNNYILIDGQQRLTVIAILMGMFKKQFRNLPEKITDYLDYEARPCDRNALETIWKKGSEWLTCKNEDELNKKMEENQIISDSMRSFIRHICEKKKKNEQEWEKKDEREWDDITGNNLFNRLMLLVSLLPDNYEKSLELQNEYFEKMNSAGKQLEPYEILKVRICKKKDDFKKWNLVEDFTKKYSLESPSPKKDEVNTENQQSQQSETTSPEEREKEDKSNQQKPPSIQEILEGTLSVDKKSITILQNKISFNNTTENKPSVEKWRPALIDFPMFLLHILSILDNKSLPADSHSLLKEFEKREIKDNNRFVELMCDYRSFLDEWIIHKDVDSCEQQSKDDGDNTDISKYSYWSWNDKDMETKHIGSADDDSKELKQIQMALSAVGDQKQEWMIDAFNFYKSYKGQNKDFRCYLRDYLVRYLVKKADIKDVLSKKELSHECLIYGNATRTQFVCLDYFLWLLARTKQEKSSSERWSLRNDIFSKFLEEGSNTHSAITNYVPKAHRSVEHFHPQTDTNSDDIIVAKWKDYKDMFGNLALISAGRNSEYGNYSVDEKAARINRMINQNDLESIKLFLMKEECNGKDCEWIPDLAHKHAQKMLEVLKWGIITHYKIDLENIMSMNING